MEQKQKLRATENGRYNPETGKGCIGRRKWVIHPSGQKVNVPVTMLRDADYATAGNDPIAFDRLRTRHDFEFWCITCCEIIDKTTGALIKFRLNTPQRHVAELFETERLAGHPLRFIMLKARQWGGSTLVQMYMAWIQCTQRRNWNSIICAHVKDTAAGIRGMYTRMLENYPTAMWLGDEDSKPGFKSYERSLNVREITGRGCRVTIGSSEKQDSARGADYAMAHLSEVAFWADTTLHNPEYLVRAVCGSINIEPMTLIVMESTANGVGNYFHDEWQRAVNGKSDKKPIFIPWYIIPIYSRPVKDREALIASLDDYEHELMQTYGCSLEQVNWYHCKRMEYSCHEQMKAEYPTTADEAFNNTGNGVFNIADIKRAESDCCEPIAVGEMVGNTLIGPEAITDLYFEQRERGPMSIWKMPQRNDGYYDSRYIVTVDVGGRSLTSDYSVIAVFDRVSYPGKLEVVAQWRGHCDHDILVWKAAAIAHMYNNAYLVYESNTLESDNTEGDPSLFILNEISYYYDNLYRRYSTEGSGRGSYRPGFHTNRSTKTMAITNLNAALRDAKLIERDRLACQEYTTYQNMANGKQGAQPGHHDDILITRAIALTVMNEMHKPTAYYEAANYIKSYRKR